MTKTDEKAYFCPSCGGAAITSSGLVGGPASCNSCQWRGTSTDLVVHVFQHELGSSSSVIEEFTKEFKNIVGQHFATPLAKLLYKWGFFLHPKPTPQEVTRYMVAMARASITALVEVRLQMEKERVSRDN